MAGSVLPAVVRGSMMSANTYMRDSYEIPQAQVKIKPYITSVELSKASPSHVKELLSI